MKKNLFWSFVATAAMVTGCSQEAIMDSGVTALNGDEVPVAFSIDLGQAISTYATSSAKGGWTNYKEANSIMRNQYDHRAIIQVFAESATTPLTEKRVVINTTTADAITSDEINIPGLRLGAGTYTAVVWVDFVAHTQGNNTSVGTDTDLFYTTTNLREVSVTHNNKLIDLSQKSPEGRDAYSGIVNFTVNNDGTFSIGGTSQTGTTISITAKRSFGKVRLVLTDFDTKAEWTKYFATTAHDADRTMNAIAMQIGKNMAIGFNALTDVPTAPTNEGVYSFFRDWGAIDNNAANNVVWITDNGKEYPILDFTYLIPISNDLTATYDMRILTFDGNDQTLDPTTWFANDAISHTGTGTEAWRCLSERNFSSIPVVKNCLTTIRGNFLTKGFDFKVTVTDNFETKLIDKTIDDNGAATETLDWGGLDVKIERNTDNTVAKITIGTTGTGSAFTAEQITAIVNNINATTDVGAATGINIYASALPATAADFSGINNAKTNLYITGVLAQATEAKFNAADAAIVNSAVQTSQLTVSSTGIVAISGSTFAAITTNVKGATFNAATYSGVVTVNAGATGATATINAGTFNDNFNSYVNTTVMGGTLDGTQSTSGTYDHFLSMRGQDTPLTLTINKATNAFGPITADVKSDGSTRLHKLVCATQDILNFYSSSYISDTFVSKEITPAP